MLRISYVNPTGMFSYEQSPNIVFPNGKLIHLLGVNNDKGGCSNASGKTSLFNAVCEILFGENPTGANKAKVINNIWGHGQCGRVEFVSWENIYYRVTYCRDWKESFYPADNEKELEYKGTELFLDKWNGQQWIDDRDRGMLETRKRIIAAVGMSYNRFLAISYMSYRVGNRFLRGTTKDREDVLSGITGVEEWDKILSKARTKRTEVNEQVTTIHNAESYIEGELNTLRYNLNQLKEIDWTKSIEGNRITLGAKEAEQQKVQLQIDSTNDQYQELLKQRSEKYDNANSYNIQQLQAELDKQNNRDLDAEAETSVQKQNKEELEKLQFEMNTASSQINLKKGELKVYKGETESLVSAEVCPMCDSKISQNKKKKISVKINRLEAGIRSEEKKFEKAKKNTDRIWTIKNRIAKSSSVERNKEVRRIGKDLVEEQKKYNIACNEYNKLNEQANAIVDSLAVLNQSLFDAKEAVTSINTEIKEATEKLVEIGKIASQIELKERELAEKTQELTLLTTKRIIYEWLINNIPYIKLHKLSATMVALSNKVNEYLANMGYTIRINVHSFDEKVKKNAADFANLLKSDIEIEITDGEKNIDPKLYSDGETGAMSVAIIFSLYDLAMGFGNGCNIRMLDEVFSFIDHENSQQIAESFIKHNDQGTTIITDNSDRASGLINFDEIWTAKKRNGKTLLEVGT